MLPTSHLLFRRRTHWQEEPRAAVEVVDLSLLLEEDRLLDLAKIGAKRCFVYTAAVEPLALLLPQSQGTVAAEEVRSNSTSSSFAFVASSWWLSL